MRLLAPLLMAVLACTVLAGAANAQMGPRAFRGGFRGGFWHGHYMRGRPYWRGVPYPLPPPRMPLPMPAPPPGGARPVGPSALYGRDQQEMARQGVRGGQMAPLDRVIASIGRQTPGRQLDTGIEYRGDRPVYRVRWITNHGQRIDYWVDAASGVILGER